MDEDVGSGFVSGMYEPQDFIWVTWRRVSGVLLESGSSGQGVSSAIVMRVHSKV